jgi:hypothetical protein
LVVKKVECRSCGATIPARCVHHGTKSDEGFLYCDRDGTVLTFCVYDEIYREVTGGGGFPFNLTREQKTEVEKRLIPCPCGGRFAFDNPLMCPECGGVLIPPMTLAHVEEAIVLDRCIDANFTWIWTHLDKKPEPNPV